MTACIFHAVGVVLFDSIDSNVDEGGVTNSVCVELNGGGTTLLGCALTVTLTTINGKAGMF